MRTLKSKLGSRLRSAGTTISFRLDLSVRWLTLPGIKVKKDKHASLKKEKKKKKGNLTCIFWKPEAGHLMARH